jgi:hypothetical protein
MSKQVPFFVDSNRRFRQPSVKRLTFEHIHPSDRDLEPFGYRLSYQLIEQRLGIFEIWRIKSLGVPAVDGCEEITGFNGIALNLE